MILVPVKTLSRAKQRLSELLGSTERSALAEAMLLDVFRALAGWPRRPTVAVVTSDPQAARHARQFSFEVIADSVNRGETEAIARATSVCEARGITATLVLPADIPLVRVSELESLAAAAPQEGAVLVPSADGRGTNAVWRRPAALFPLSFGGTSFTRHLRAAQATDKACVVLHREGIALDVDTPDDLARLLAAEITTGTQRLLQQWNMRERLLAASRP